MWHIHQLATHLEHVEIPRYPTAANDDHLDLRVRWSLSEVSDRAFKSELQKREKGSQRKREIGLVLQMLLHTLAEQLTMYVRGTEDIFGTVSSVIAYSNKAMWELSRTYGCVVPMVYASTGRIRKVRARSSAYDDDMSGVRSWHVYDET